MVGTRSQRIPLSSLTALTLHKNKRTAARRTAPIPQLSCRGSACRTYQPDVVQCVAVGSDGAGGLEWKCEADLPRGVRFGEVQVGCEGWDGPDDPFIFRGSCGLEYSLVRSSGALEDGGFARTLPSSFKSYLPRSTGSLFESGFNIVIAALTAYLVISFLSKLFPRLGRRIPSIFGGGGGPGGHNGGGGGGSGPSRPPPPPGGPPPPYTPKPPTPHADGGASWRPGFWTGAAAGWAVNVLMGAARPPRERERRGLDPLDYAAAYGDGRNFWRGGAGGGATQRRGWGGWGAGAPGGRRFDDDGDRGVGGSGSGGGMRRSAGFGGTSAGMSTQESSCDPSPPTFKRRHALRGFRRPRPAPSPAPPFLPGALAVDGDDDAPAAKKDKDKGRAENVAPARQPVAAGGWGPEQEAIMKEKGYHPAVAAAWLPLWATKETGAAELASSERPAADDARGNLSLGSSLTTLGSPRRSVSLAQVDDAMEENDENRPPAAGFHALTSGGWRTLADAPERNEDLPTSVDEVFANVLLKTRKRLDAQAKKRRASFSDVASATASTSARKKRRVQLPPQSASWEDEDLTPPDPTVPRRFPFPVPVALGPAFLGADELDALSPRSRARVLHKPYLAPLELERPSATAFDADADPGRAPARKRTGGTRRPQKRADAVSDGGVVRLEPGQAAKGSFLCEVRQTAFGVLQPPRGNKGKGRGRALLPPRRLQSVQELGGQLDALALGGVSRTQKLKPTGKKREWARDGRVRRLTIGREEDAGDVGHLDERAASQQARTARRLPPQHQTGVRPAARPYHSRFEVPRRPPPQQLALLYPPRAIAPHQTTALEVEQPPNPLGKVDPAAPALRSAKQRHKSFRFVVGVKARKALTVVGGAASEEAENADAEMADWVEADSPPLREGTLLRREHPPTPITVRRERIVKTCAGDAAAKGPLLRRVSTHAGLLFNPQRQETEPLNSQETPRMQEDQVGDQALAEQDDDDDDHDGHDSSHSFRGESPAASPSRGLSHATTLLVLNTPNLPSLSAWSAFASVPPAQQQRPRCALPIAQQVSAPSSFEHAARAVLAAAGSSSPSCMLNPPDLLQGQLGTGSSTSSGLALYVPLRTRSSVSPAADDADRWLTGVGPTAEEEEPDPSLPGAHADEAEEQHPPASALLDLSRELGIGVEQGEEDEYDEGADDEPFTADIPFTQLAVAGRTRRMVLPAPKPRPAPKPKPKAVEAGGETGMVRTPPESTRKPARVGRSQRG